MIIHIFVIAIVLYLFIDVVIGCKKKGRDIGSYFGQLVSTFVIIVYFGTIFIHGRLYSCHDRFDNTLYKDAIEGKEYIDYCINNGMDPDYNHCIEKLYKAKNDIIMYNNRIKIINYMNSSILFDWFMCDGYEDYEYIKINL